MRALPYKRDCSREHSFTHTQWSATTENDFAYSTREACTTLRTCIKSQTFLCVLYTTTSAGCKREQVQDDDREEDDHQPWMRIIAEGCLRLLTDTLCGQHKTLRTKWQREEALMSPVEPFSAT
jgi:hypothetical protein